MLADPEVTSSVSSRRRRTIATPLRARDRRRRRGAHADWWAERRSVNGCGADRKTRGGGGATSQGRRSTYWTFDRVPEPKTAKNRWHWDVVCDDLDALLGRVRPCCVAPDDDIDWHVLADPEGNEFCAFASAGCGSMTDAAVLDLSLDAAGAHRRALRHRVGERRRGPHRGRPWRPRWRGLGHLTVDRDGDTVVARTSLGRDERVVLAGHLDTGPVGRQPAVPRRRPAASTGGARRT